MLKVTGEETRDEGLQDVEVPQRAPARSKELREETKDRSPSSREGPAIEKQRPETPEPDVAKTLGEPRKSFLRRRPIASALGAILAAAVMGAGAIYFDYTEHFQSTDDAFIASRQIAIAPKVSGYVTQVPVTDNEHVTAGGVIARIDDRDYRVALEQADAQVAAAQAAIKNIDAQLNVQKAQINASRAQLEQAQAGLVFAKQQAERYEHLAGTGYGTVQNAQQYSSQLRQQQAGVQNFEASLKVQERGRGAASAAQQC